jgi:hypothetical protein
MINPELPFERKMIFDADVLIDFVKTDITVLDGIVKYIGHVYILEDTVKEVRDIESIDELTERGLILIEVDIDDANAAGRITGSLSYQDRLCFLTAKRHNAQCVTNNKHLRNLCTCENISVIWGIEVLTILSEAGGISTSKAFKIANDISKINPYITKNIIINLADRLGIPQFK